MPNLHAEMYLRLIESPEVRELRSELYHNYSLGKQSKRLVFA